jgi:hypothetical protein
MDRDDYYSQERVEWRFQEHWKELREKLSHLSPDERQEAQDRLRGVHEEHERDFQKLNGEFRGRETSESYISLGTELMEKKDAAVRAWEHMHGVDRGAQDDKAQEAWDRMQQERGRDQGQEKEPER